MRQKPAWIEGLEDTLIMANIVASAMLAAALLWVGARP